MFLQKLRNAQKLIEKIRFKPTVIYYNYYPFGFADISRGVVSTFLFALLLNLPFKIYTPPKKCDLYRFLHPNCIDWRITNKVSSRGVLYQEDSERYMTIDWFVKYFGRSKQWKISTNQFMFFLPRFKEDPHFQLTKKKRKSYTDILYSVLFGLLFKPSPKLQKLLDPYLGKMKRYYNVAIHIRESDKDFSKKLDKDYMPILTKCVNKVLRGKKHVQYLLIGNSPAFIDQMKEYFRSRHKPYIITSRVKSHVDTGGCNSLASTLLDWYLVGECNTVFFSVGSFAVTGGLRKQRPLYQLAKCYKSWGHVAGKGRYLPCCKRYECKQ